MLLIKVGGGKEINWDGIARDISYLLSREKIVLVHGASYYRDELARRLSIPIKTVVSPSGISSVYTDQQLLEALLMAYAGLVNKKIVARLQKEGLRAVGLSGVDGELWQAKAKKEIPAREGDRVILLKNNLTGRVEEINTELINLLVENNYLPVICSPAISFEKEIVNTDNDWAIAVMAEKLKIKKLVVLFENPGLLENPDDESTLVPWLEKEKIADYLPLARDRMKKKILGAKRAIEGGVEVIFWGDGRIVNPVLNALEGKGTVIS
ncbi:MAG: [LysW]-aminoadipate kinase [Candidatus Saccharicenans sp.]|nr:[LysW]-aminoadipate kinase [Candidatus Saccharicenans sp.]